MLRAGLTVSLCPLQQSRAGQFGLAEADCFERLPGVNLRMATHFSDALSFPSGWEVRQGVADFVHEVLSQAKPHFVEPTLGDELAQLALRLARLATTWDARKVCFMGKLLCISEQKLASEAVSQQL